MHYRSVILGNLAYEDYIDSKKIRDEISGVLVLIGKGEIKISSEEKVKLYTIKDISVKTTRYLYKRMISIRKNTGFLRDKIRDECGPRGRKWYDKNRRNVIERK